MVKKFASLNNALSRRIIYLASVGESRKCYTLLFNSRTEYHELLFLKLYWIVFDMCPLTFNDYMSLHPQIQSYMSHFYLKCINETHT